MFDKVELNVSITNYNKFQGDGDDKNLKYKMLRNIVQMHSIIIKLSPSI